MDMNTTDVKEKNRIVTHIETELENIKDERMKRFIKGMVFFRDDVDIMRNYYHHYPEKENS
jgi:hypothetical protein